MLSILIPTYNYNVVPLVLELYKQCLECEIDFEIIVFSDGGILFENENLNVREFSNCKYISSTINIGRTQARKTLSNNAKYNLLLFLDADVFPTTNNFIKNYIDTISSNDYDVIMGGCSYKIESLRKENNLRYFYGVKREQQTALKRNQKKYAYVLSGNMIIKKNVFEEVNYKEVTKYYGMDIFLSYNLMINRNSVFHIDNSTFHFGLENDTVFFDKCLSSLKSRKETLLDMPRIEEINSLLKYYKILKKYRLLPIAIVCFRIFRPILKKLILNKNPNLQCFDFYRLGYLCSLK
jgi:hypothetical protein